MPFPFLPWVPAIPECPGLYGSKHPDRKNEFPENKEGFFVDPSPQETFSHWRHELDHDAESVFWLLLYWAMVVQPEGHPAEETEEMNSGWWSDLNGNHEDRGRLIDSFTGKLPHNVIHSVYKPLGPLIRDLATILRVDRYWFPASDPRNNLYYINEAFQRLILKFILDHRHDEFMHRPVDKTFRRVKVLQDSHAISATGPQSLDEANRSLVSCVYEFLSVLIVVLAAHG